MCITEGGSLEDCSLVLNFYSIARTRNGNAEGWKEHPTPKSPVDEREIVRLGYPRAGNAWKKYCKELFFTKFQLPSCNSRTVVNENSRACFYSKYIIVLENFALRWNCSTVIVPSLATLCAHFLVWYRSFNTTSIFTILVGENVVEWILSFAPTSLQKEIKPRRDLTFAQAPHVQANNFKTHAIESSSSWSGQWKQPSRPDFQTIAATFFALMSLKIYRASLQSARLRWVQAKRLKAKSFFAMPVRKLLYALAFCDL